MVEERINEISIEIGNNCADFYSNDIDFNVIKDGLRQIATEQKAIDDAERDTAVYKLLLLKLDNEKKLWLDKACKWLKDNIHKDLTIGTYADTLESLVDDFRKAMEE